MPVSASTMIFAALVNNGEKSIGDTLTSAEGTYYLDKLNSMLDSWSVERLMCYQVVQNSTTLTASTESYTIGTNGTFAVARPTKIVDPCFIRDSDGNDTPVKLIDVAAYGRIVDKDAGFTVPTHMYYDAGFSATSTGTINVYPSPSGSLTLFINSWNPLQSFANISTVMLLPPGYQRAIESNFTIEAAVGLRSVQPEIVKIAREAKAAIATVNLPETVMRLDMDMRTLRNILTG